MLHIALWEPEVRPNTGNVVRLCVATGACSSFYPTPRARSAKRRRAVVIPSAQRR